MVVEAEDTVIDLDADDNDNNEEEDETDLQLVQSINGDHLKPELINIDNGENIDVIFLNFQTDMSG